MSQLPPPIPPAQSPPPVQQGVVGGLPGRAPHRAGLVGGLGIGGLALSLISSVGSLAFAPCCGGGLIALGMSIAAWVMANADLKAMQSGAMDPSGESMTKTGKICAIISVALAAVGLVIGVLLVILGIGIFAAAAAGAAGGGGTP